MHFDFVLWILWTGACHYQICLRVWCLRIGRKVPQCMTAFMFLFMEKWTFSISIMIICKLHAERPNMNIYTCPQVAGWYDSLQLSFQAL